MRRNLRRAGKIALAAAAAYLVPWVFAVYAACGIYDVWRNDERSPSLLERYFLGNGFFVFLLSPVNVLLDLLSLPYINRGVYRLDDLPAGHRREIVRLIEAANRQNLVSRLQQATARGGRSMFFFKWYATNVETVLDVPEFHDDY